MKKRIVWLTAAAAAFGLHALAEVVITSPTGLSDESDVALEKTVDSVKALPADTVAVVGDVISYTADEIRNTAHGVKSAFQGELPREVAREKMLSDVTDAWSSSDDILMRTYAVSDAVGDELAGSQDAGTSTLDVRSFFKGIDFPEGATAYYRPDGRRLVVFNTPASLRAVEEVLSRYHHAERDYKQVEINAKFIEVSQSTLNELGFSWRIEDTGGITGVRLFDDWQVDAPQDLLAAGLRTAAGAFGAGVPGAGSMVLTRNGWMPLQLTIDALEQASDSDVLSSPSLITKDGKTAEIWVGEDRQVPESFEVNSVEVNVHVQHTDWNSELMGVYFSVTPEIREENIIRLELSPKIVDLIGYDTYQVCPKGSMMTIAGQPLRNTAVSGRYPILKYAGDGISSAWEGMSDSLIGIGGFLNPEGDPNDVSAWNSSVDNYTKPNYGFYDQMRKATHEEYGIKLAAINGSLPYFRVREIETQVDVADGSTVGLGGLIYDRLETYKDKVPVLGSIPLLGRLFRSEGERSIKRNLMIFVTATQVADNGQRKSDIALKN
ncbi:MAG: hypothetical protein JEZ10_06960 [Verrucomicrobia bacterium]|nr:hypothetical protein [Verrucomicrobiota bacterium]